MKSTSYRISVWVIALTTILILLVAAVLAILSPEGQDERFMEVLSGAIIGCGAPILGLVILRNQPRNRIGWLWMVFGLSVAFFSLSYALKYRMNASSASGYPDPLFVMLLFSETSYIVRFITLILLMLWFPDGQPPSPRWRFMHWWLLFSLVCLTLELFAVRVPWSDAGGYQGGAPLIHNPVGFLPESLAPVFEILPPIGFFSIVLMILLAAISIIIRYRKANRLVRAQVRWFVMGSVSYAILFIAALFLPPNLSWTSGVIGNLAILPFYLAIGIAITRYRLYDIDVIIRKTLLYSLLTVTLALLYFGLVVLLQALSDFIFGIQSPVIIVLSTLVIAALFNPLRTRIQVLIDRRFFRRKYDAEKALAQFAAAARNETDIECLTSEILEVVQETMQPENVSVWMVNTTKNEPQP